MTLTLTGSGPSSGTAAPFDPNSISGGLLAGFDFSAVPAGAIASQPDLSTNANALVQATAGKRPTGVAAVQNGLNIARFVSANSTFLKQTSTFGPLSQPFTIFLVGAMTTASSFAQYFDGNGSDRQAFGDFNNDGKHDFFAGTVVGAVQARPTGFHVWSLLFNGASSQVWKDGASFLTGNPGTAFLSGITLGSNSGGTANFLDGDIGVYYCYNASLSTADRQTVEAAQKSKWGTP